MLLCHICYPVGAVLSRFGPSPCHRVWCVQLLRSRARGQGGARVWVLSMQRDSAGGRLMIIGYTRMKEFLRRSAGVDIEKSDMERLTDLIGQKLNDLLVIGVRNASYNNRDIVMEPDLPLTKGVLERLKDFRRYEE